MAISRENHILPDPEPPCMHRYAVAAFTQPHHSTVETISAHEKQKGLHFRFRKAILTTYLPLSLELCPADTQESTGSLQPTPRMGEQWTLTRFEVINIKPPGRSIHGVSSLLSKHCCGYDCCSYDWLRKDRMPQVHQPQPSPSLHYTS
ncbi:hypothetical protein P7K49_016300 [Saguinus oedipus]|uniref:Uncharacterized protein n=1 Tax=Saguinus oedipus TaxID=9490 RepID=A0ABQ9VBY8_SAGOE|nr:hypothetical protein P7K49_016300 [Saguinus oedipus]